MTVSDSNRARRFALPDLEDERAAEAIEAFLHRREADRGREQTTVAADPAPERLAGRLEWAAAFERERERTDRYGRPTSVAVLELGAARGSAALDSWLAMAGSSIGRIVRGASRSSDLVARVSQSRIHVLLPETPEGGANRFAERVLEDGTRWLDSMGAPLAVRAGVAAAGDGTSLDDALASAVRALEAAA